MTYKNQTYYWVLPLNEGKWTLAKHIQGTWHFIDGRSRLTNDLGQTGEEIPTNDELVESKKIKTELIKKLQDMTIWTSTLDRIADNKNKDEVSRVIGESYRLIQKAEYPQYNKD